MLTIKNWVRSTSALVLAATLFLTGCTPPGPRALLQGQHLLEQGKYTEALPHLETATRLLATNVPPAITAQAWNDLGIALQHTGQSSEAELAYLRALASDHDLTEATFNLGCLYLEQNRLEAAKAQFTTYTLRRGTAPEGFLKLGTVELRAGESGSYPSRLRALAAAESSFKEVLKLNAHSPEALNGLGLVHYYRNQSKEAAQDFTAALRQQPHFGPALLNLAIVAQHRLRDPQLALQKYQEYLALKPAPPDAQAVSLAAQELEQELHPAARPAAPPAAAGAQAGIAGTAANQSAQANAAAKAEPVAAAAQAATRAAMPGPSGAPAAHVPETKPGDASAQSAPGASGVVASASSGRTDNSGQARSAVATHTAHRSLFQRMNPLNLFGSAEGISADPAKPGAQGAATQLPVVPAPPGARYAYSPAVRAPAGNPEAAQKAFTRGLDAQGARHWSEAVKDYLAATQLDPGFFKAFYNLGLAAAQAGELRTALVASERAVALQPTSGDARYNFALVLKQAGYFLDAANELEKLLTYLPNDGRTHLALANLYSQQFHQPAKARPHYERFLELDPHNKQADSIRYWLVQNRS